MERRKETTYERLLRLVKIGYINDVNIIINREESAIDPVTKSGIHTAECINFTKRNGTPVTLDPNSLKENR